MTRNYNSKQGRGKRRPFKYGFNSSGNTAFNAMSILAGAHKLKDAQKWADEYFTLVGKGAAATPATVSVAESGLKAGVIRDIAS